MSENGGIRLRRHARERCQQRGVPWEDVAACLRYGRRRPWKRGACLYYLGKRELRRAIRRDGSIRCRWDRLWGLAVVVDRLSGDVLTVYKERRGVQQIRRNALARGRKTCLRRDPWKRLNLEERARMN